MATKRKKNAKSLKIFYETRRRRALVFSVWHLVVNLYQVCSNVAPGVKTGPDRWGGVAFLDIETKKDYFKILLV